MTSAELSNLLSPVTRWLSDRNFDGGLEPELNRNFAADGSDYQALFSACRQAIAAGSTRSREALISYLLPQGAIKLIKP